MEKFCSSCNLSKDVSGSVRFLLEDYYSIKY